MGTGYVRQSTAEIQTDLIVQASSFNTEFNKIQDAFSATIGHTHSGAVGEGPKINLTASVTGVLPVANGGTGQSTALMASGIGTSVYGLITSGMSVQAGLQALSDGISAKYTLPSVSGNNGKFLTTDGTNTSWATVTSYSLPAQTGNSGKFLTTNGTSESWATVDAFPSQTGNSGKYLLTNGTSTSWSTINFPVINPFSAISTNTTAVAFTRYIVNTASGVVTVTLPTSPTVGDQITVVRRGVNQVIIGRNAMTIAGIADDLGLDSDKYSVTLLYEGSNNWLVKGEILA